MVTSDEQENYLCVEIAIAAATWVERLPPAPGGPDAPPVTLSFDDHELAARDRTAVTDLGYQLVGTAKVGHVSDVVHLLVALTAVDGHQRWWRALVDLATRVYDLRFGPVKLALRDVLTVHLEQRANGTATTLRGTRDLRHPSA